MGVAVWSRVWKQSAFPGIAVACGMFLSALLSVFGAKEAVARACRVEAVDFAGWQAQQISNVWIKFRIVPQRGPIRLGKEMGETFSVFAYGHLEAKLSDANGDKLKTVPLVSVSTEKLTELDQTIIAPNDATEVSLSLIDASGKDHRILAASKIVSKEKNR